MGELNFKETAAEIQRCLLKLTFKGNGGGGVGGGWGGGWWEMGWGVVGGKEEGKKDGGLKIIGLLGIFPHFALSWLADWVPVWRGLVIKDGICSRRVPQSNANFCSLSTQTPPPTRPPLTDVKRNLYCQSHILFTLFTCADNPELRSVYR